MKQVWIHQLTVILSSGCVVTMLQFSPLTKQPRYSGKEPSRNNDMWFKRCLSAAFPSIICKELRIPLAWRAAGSVFLCNYAISQGSLSISLFSTSSELNYFILFLWYFFWVINFINNKYFLFCMLSYLKNLGHEKLLSISSMQ